MTPPATARSPRRSAPGSRRTPASRPRRISGPGAPARSGAVAAAVAIPAPGIALPRERKSRPGVAPRRRQAGKGTRHAAHGAPGIALRAIDAFEGVSSSAFLDRLVRGRLWIGLLAFALIGIVAMQLLVLKLNTGIGRTLGRVETLQRANAQLGIEDSVYSAEGRVAPLAAAAGMTLAPAGTVHFVVASDADVARAGAALSAATKTPASGSSEVSSTTGGESSPAAAGSGTEAQTSSGSSSQSPVPSGEATDTSESSSSLGAGAGEAAAGGGESASTADSPSSSSTSTASPSTPATAAPSAAGAQATGAPATPSSSTVASATQASGPAGGTQAGTGE